jgi:5-methyltetrahydrofolate--homocysteine methyltransferase
MSILADGGMGTMLLAAGLEPGGCGDLLNLEQPDIVANVHRAYIDAGARVILTNTFGASSLALARHGLAELATQINESGAALARSAASADTLVLGDIGPFGGFIEPVGDAARCAVFDAFHLQAHALLAGGAHGIIVETMGALDEMELAVLAAREAGADLIVASMSFERTRVGLRTLTGVSPRAAAEHLGALGVDVLGTNCGTGMNADDYCEVVREYRLVDACARVLVKMNAGTPRLVRSGTVYDLSPDRFADWVRAVTQAGADIVGGCCGTTPQHISAARRLIGQSDVMMKSGAPSNS